MDECIHGMYPANTCTICNGKDKNRPKVRAKIVRTFRAQYSGHCDAECGQPLLPDTNIAMLEYPSGDKGYAHPDCVELIEDLLD